MSENVTRIDNWKEQTDLYTLEDGTLTMNDNITEIGNRAFKTSQTESKSIQAKKFIANKVTKIGCQSFYNFKNLETITLPNTITISVDKIGRRIPFSASYKNEYFGSEAFFRCIKLKSVIFLQTKKE